ncbi:hypothetical protein BTHERMOSOX_1039 [Bathymodiolus thermophilus thioautotrophic gill symbiont]|uniref:Uncharacterized protein n=1 Tax=Bathymodiolus thermophilus thioautotrophic gill symbiont TaxID=2360 RepID=A0A8H9CFY8_9GAMM|nr:hypothetical protein [Bathymodiolus thermophilus thioautotrophic gill symbiont]CAB5495551.1 hypothetical protein THERMOS_310 [Bathymodiolus thermophilus thioautotrophic gill symbiont]CAB5499780.1 hypothetical protein THERMOT_1121 [Bathymodiolus thermophilus thioautotrophic gill symbiont]SHA29728.1 hypothetical protein BTHERMOSOX_1039 [Bathymodiolus thermophilus thioautotrophic gill symbiont]
MKNGINASCNITHTFAELYEQQKTAQRIYPWQYDNDTIKKISLNSKLSI